MQKRRRQGCFTALHSTKEKNKIRNVKIGNATWVGRKLYMQHCMGNQYDPSTPLEIPVCWATHSHPQHYKCWLLISQHLTALFHHHTWALYKAMIDSMVHNYDPYFIGNAHALGLYCLFLCFVFALFISFFHWSNTQSSSLLKVKIHLRAVHQFTTYLVVSVVFLLALWLISWWYEQKE